jgi:hypothetical protein
MTFAIVPGTVVWSVLAGIGVVWLAVLALSSRSGALLSPRRLARWLLGSWLSRGIIIAAWAAAGWHMFCQRP